MLWTQWIFPKLQIFSLGSVSREVIDEDEYILWTTHGFCRNGSADIKMNQPQNTFCTDFLPPIKLVLRVFSNNTTFPNSTGSFDGREAFHHGMILKFQKVFRIKISKPFMPQPTDLIPMIQKGSGLCIMYKLGELIGLSRMIRYTCCNEFSRCNL